MKGLDYISMAIKDLPDNLALNLYLNFLVKVDEDSFVISSRQYSDILIAYRSEQFAWQYCRGAGKTRNMSMLAVFF